MEENIQAAGLLSQELTKENGLIKLTSSKHTQVIELLILQEEKLKKARRFFNITFIREKINYG